MVQDKDTEGALLRKVRELLHTAEAPSLEIYKATGIAPNQQWAIKAGKTKSPSVNAIETLYTFLSGKKLEL